MDKKDNEELLEKNKQVELIRNWFIIIGAIFTLSPIIVIDYLISLGTPGIGIFITSLSLGFCFIVYALLQPLKNMELIS